VANSPARLPLPIPEISERLRAQFGEDVTEAVDRHEHAEVRVAPKRYREMVQTLRDDEEFGLDYLDFVSATDYPERGELEVVVHLYSTAHNHHVRLKVSIPRDDPRCPTISDLYPGASWHERETWELFGIVFEGHPHLVKLVLPEPFEGYPLRKDFVLMSREAKVWPGDVEGEEVEEE